MRRKDRRVRISHVNVNDNAAVRQPPPSMDALDEKTKAQILAQNPELASKVGLDFGIITSRYLDLSQSR
jgi:hypothetical protein